MSHAGRGAAEIEDHGVIGDLRTAALVATDGTIDFWCAPSFDSPSVFASLLDPEGGRFALAPRHAARRLQQLYLPDTNVLVTRFLEQDGVAEIVDFMPPFDLGPEQAIVRTARAVLGEIELELELDARFGYGRQRARATPGDGGAVIESPDGTVALRLRCPPGARATVHDGVVRAQLTLAAGAEASFVLETVHASGGASRFERADAARVAFDDTVAYWRRWIDRSEYQGRWREIVRRSALALKLMASAQHGSYVASPTFGLPEHVGGGRNWDCRYAWLRDTAFQVRAFTLLGFDEDAAKLEEWLEHRCLELADDPPLPVMFAVDGGRDLDEHVLEHFAGYRGSTPVRVGNAAHRQLQLDVYGELLDALYGCDGAYAAPHHDVWTALVEIIGWLADNWRRPDRGIWEVRRELREHLHSRVMCWVAFDRAVRLARRASRPAPLDEWRRVRDDIYRDVYARFWNEELRAFTSHPGCRTLDAAALIMPLVGFSSPTDVRWLGTMEAIERELVEDSLVHRYQSDVGASKAREGTFSLCTFWWVECLSRAGQLDRARLVFEKMLAHANHLGLYSEMLGRCGEHLGNFPQALTHLGLISAACDLDSRLSRAARGR